MKAREHTNKKPALLKKKRTKDESYPTEKTQFFVMERVMDASPMEENETL